MSEDILSGGGVDPDPATGKASVAGNAVSLRIQASLVIIQTIATLLALFSTWGQRIRVLLAIFALASIVLLPPMIRRIAQRPFRRKPLAVLVATLSLAAGLISATFIFHQSTRNESADVAISVRARTFAGESGRPSGTHGLVQAETWSEDTAATVGDTVEWQINTHVRGKVANDLKFHAAFPPGITPVGDPNTLVPVGPRDYLVRASLSRAKSATVVVRGTIDANSGKCPGSEFLSVMAETSKSILAVAVAPVVIFDRSACKQAQDAATGVFSPTRQTWDWNNDKKGPTTRPVLNSYVNTTVYGDERGFLDAALATKESSGGFSNLTPVSSFGDRVLVRFYVINDANQAIQPLLTANGTRVRLDIPSVPGTSLRLHGRITSSNVDPETVEDTADISSDLSFRLEYVPGSAKAYSNEWPRGTTVSDHIATSDGALVGSKHLDGDLLPDFAGSLLVTLELRVVHA